LVTTPPVIRERRSVSVCFVCFSVFSADRPQQEQQQQEEEEEENTIAGDEGGAIGEKHKEVVLERKRRDAEEASGGIPDAMTHLSSPNLCPPDDDHGSPTGEEKGKKRRDEAPSSSAAVPSSFFSLFSPLHPSHDGRYGGRGWWRGGGEEEEGSSLPSWSFPLAVWEGGAALVGGGAVGGEEGTTSAKRSVRLGVLSIHCAPPQDHRHATATDPFSHARVARHDSS